MISLRAYNTLSSVPYSPSCQQNLHPLRPCHSHQHSGRRRVRRPETRSRRGPHDLNLRLDLYVADSRALFLGRLVEAGEARFFLVRVQRGGEPGPGLATVGHFSD